MFGLVVFLLMVLVAVFAPLLAHYSPNTQFREGLEASGNPLGPSARFWLGTDDLGRDLLLAPCLRSTYFYRGCHSCKHRRHGHRG